jgi:hypothetical protein
MIACNWTGSAGTGTWGGNGTLNSSGTGTTWYAFTNAYDMWRQAERVAEAIRKYEESRNWTNAPVSTRPHCPPTSRNNFRNIFTQHHISPRPWTGRNFHK